jgi:hypothetical protein
MGEQQQQQQHDLGWKQVMMEEWRSVNLVVE